MGSIDMNMYNDRKNKHWCVQCGAPLKTNKTYCKRCSDEIAQLNKERYNMRSASGLCVRCGELLQDKDRLKNGKMAKSCKECRDYKKKIRKIRGWK